jgi:hypothetical protein
METAGERVPCCTPTTIQNAEKLVGRGGDGEDAAIRAPPQTTFS